MRSVGLFVAICLAMLCSGVTAQRVDQTRQYNALKEFYEATGGPGWKNNTLWLDGPPCGKDMHALGNEPWHGLICDIGGAVTNLNLINNGLKGTLPDKLFTDLQFIQRINIGQNNIVGTIPKAICSAGWLLTFAAQLNRGLGGRLPECITSLPFLEELILEMTSVSGTIPTVGFPKIKVLILSNSKFSGTIPDIFQSMADLRVLILNGCSSPGSGPHCKLHGTIPPSLYTLPSLFLFSLQQNMLNGTIGEFQHMKKLREIHFNDNKLTGDIPPSLLRQFSKPVIRENATRGMLHLENNKFTGRVDKQYENLQFMKEVGIYNNKFTGYPPKAFFTHGQKDAPKDEKWELFPNIKESLSKITWLPGLAPWAVKMGAKSHPMQVNRVSPTIMPTPDFQGNQTYNGPTVYFYGTGLFQMYELHCGFFRADLKVHLGDQCNGVPPGSPDGMPDCVKTRAVVLNSTTVMCQPIELAGMVGPVSSALIFWGDDNDKPQNTTHVISPPKTIIMYEPKPIIRSISPREGRYQGCTTITIRGTKFVNTGHQACYFDEIWIPATVVSNTTVTCVAPPMWSEEWMNRQFVIRYSPMNGTSYAKLAPDVQAKDVTFNYIEYCDLDPYNGVMGMPTCDCGLCPCGSLGTCILNASMIPVPRTEEDFEDDESAKSGGGGGDAPGKPQFPFCYCLPGFAGDNCTKCKDGHWGQKCEKCDCEHGRCHQGRGGDGACSCELWWGSTRCDYYYYPAVMQGLAVTSLIAVAVMAVTMHGKMKAARSSEEKTPLMQNRGADELYTTPEPDPNQF